MLQSRWTRRSAVVFAAMLMSLVGLVTPASAEDPEVEFTFTPHCVNGIAKFTNNLEVHVQAWLVVDGVGTDRETIGPGESAVIAAPAPAGQTVLAHWERLGVGDVHVLDPVTHAKPVRCDDFAVTFTDSCDSTTVSVTNNHDDVYLRIYAPGVPTVVHQGAFGFEDTFTDTFPMSAGDKMIVEITFGAGGLIDYVAEHEFVATGCEPEPEYPTTVEDTCTGVRVTVTNDSDETLPVHVRRLRSSEEPYIGFDLAPGETKTVEIDVPSGIDIAVTSIVNELDLAHHTTAHKDCPELPKTGTDVMTIVLAGLGVLIVGAGVLFGLHLARRRKLSEQ